MSSLFFYLSLLIETGHDVLTKGYKAGSRNGLRLSTPHDQPAPRWLGSAAQIPVATGIRTPKPETRSTAPRVTVGVTNAPVGVTNAPDSSAPRAGARHAQPHKHA